MDAKYFERGFLPKADPVCQFTRYPQLRLLDELGDALPDLLLRDNFRETLAGTKIPDWPEHEIHRETLPELRLYYLRLGFLVSGYVNQVSQARAHVLPENLATPFARACRLLERPPILSYDGYALYNWRRLRSSEPIALGNIDTIQNFVKLYDEHWFILVHVEIEAIAGEILAAIERVPTAIVDHDRDAVDYCLARIADAIDRQTEVLKRIPERMRPELYFREFRPYIRFFENVTYSGVDSKPMNFRGETGAQSSIMPTLVAFMKIPHTQSILTEHLRDMCRFMPAEHRKIIERVERMPNPRDLASPVTFNRVLDAMASFREVHLGWADQYVHQRVDDPRGTGGTPYMTWLKQLIDETRAARKQPIAGGARKQPSARGARKQPSAGGAPGQPSAESAPKQSSTGGIVP